MTSNITKVTAASIAAISATSLQGSAIAEEVTTDAKGNPLTVTVVGGLVLSDFSQNNPIETIDNYGFNKLGDDSEDTGGFGAISIGRAFEEGSAFDWRITGSVTEFIANDRSGSVDFYYGGYAADAQDDADWQHFDMEVGHTAGNDTTNLRIAAGLRLSHLDRSTSGGYGANAYGYEANLTMFGNSEFVGGGPRASIEGRVGGTVGIEFAASVSGLFGKESESAGLGLNYEILGYDYVSFGGDDSSSDWKWLTDAEVSAGLSIRPSDSVSVSAGYRYEQITNLANTFSEDKVTASGPYMKMEVKF